MKTFALLFRLNHHIVENTSQSQLEERAKWLAGLIAQNLVVDSGNTLLMEPNLIVTAEGVIAEDVVGELRDFVSGYLTIKAENIEQTLEIVQSNPIFKVGGKIEVREVLQRAT